MSTPSWLYYLFGGLMLAVAAYCLTLLALSLATGRRAGRDVEISHTFMGVAMAGMFVGQWAFGRPAVWEIIFGALMIWFLVESIQSVRQYGLHLPHALIHAVMNLAMLLMYWFPMGSSTGAMSMSASPAGPKLDPGVALVVAFILFASAIFTLASPYKGSSHFGSHAPAYAVVGPVGSLDPDDRPGVRSGSVGMALEEIVATPWLVDMSHVIMCVAMGFMLLLLT
jgi:CDP-diglyceride synthetase